MNNTINILLFIFLIISSSCNKEKSKYSIYWEGNNLCVVMPHPTMGIVSLGQINWCGVELNEVNDHILDEIHKTNLSGNALVWVRFEKPEHDKYGNETMSYDDHLVATIPISEGKKYKSGNYLDTEYGIKNRIIQSAFPRNGFSPNGTNIYYVPGDSLPKGTTNQVDSSYYASPTEVVDPSQIIHLE